MGHSAGEVIPRFVKYAGKPHGYEPDGKNGRLRKRFWDGSGSSLYYATNHGRIVEIMSYGSHFPLGRLILTPSGRKRLWVLNGDVWSRGGFGRTNTHNDMMREAAQKSGTPWIILPNSALRESGIDVDTIVPVHQERERWEPEDHSAATLEQVPAHHRTRRVYRDATGTEVVPPRASDGTEASPDYQGEGWHVYRRSALEGSQSIPVPGPEYKRPLDVAWEEVTPAADGRYHWSEQRHWLGESVFRASHQVWDLKKEKMVRYTRYYLSAFDQNEARPLYFLAELPRGARPQTVAEAREALKPPQVTLAEEFGLAVQRQGDVFAVPMPGMATRDLPGPSQHSARVLGVNHHATEVRLMDGRTFARGKLYHDRHPREHATITLRDGKTWHELVKNTVPMNRRWDGQLESRAWSLGGMVD